ncbi:MAG TPA: hypothetical protein VH083_21440 [Myxococcales bacterium]|nr:hypothetical protein [Myxococcales bacterium]
MRLFCVLALAAAACGGTSDSVQATQKIALDREPFDMGGAFVGSVQSESLQIINQGRANLTISSIKLTQPDGGVLPNAAAGGFDQPQLAADGGTAGSLPVVIGGLGTGFVQFNWGPKSKGNKVAQLSIASDDPTLPLLVTTVTGCAVPIDGGASGCVCGDGGTPGADGGC